MNSADQLLYNASLLLEDEGDIEGAMDAIHEAIALAEVAKYPLQLLRARMFLGELLLELGRDDEARAEFEEVLRLAPQFADDPDAVDQEVAVAGEHLARLESDNATPE
jgi:tetratricopeptide (TPR) repeat protein